MIHTQLLFATLAITNECLYLERAEQIGLVQIENKSSVLFRTKVVLAKSMVIILLSS